MPHHATQETRYWWPCRLARLMVDIGGSSAGVGGGGGPTEGAEWGGPARWGGGGAGGGGSACGCKQAGGESKGGAGGELKGGQVVSQRRGWQLVIGEVGS